MAEGKERRAHPRYVCDGGVEVRSGESRGFWGTLADISMGGCYVQSFSPMPVGTELKLLIKAKGFEVQVVQAAVVAFHPGVGMGIQFNLIETEEHEKLEKLVAFLASTEQPTGMSGTLLN